MQDLKATDMKLLRMYRIAISVAGSELDRIEDTGAASEGGGVPRYDYQNIY